MFFQYLFVNRDPKNLAKKLKQIPINSTTTNYTFLSISFKSKQWFQQNSIKTPLSSKLSLEIIRQSRDKLKSPIRDSDHPVETPWLPRSTRRSQTWRESTLVKIRRAHTHLLSLCMRVSVDHGGESNTWLPLSEQVTLPVWPFTRDHHPPKTRVSKVVPACVKRHFEFL